MANEFKVKNGLIVDAGGAQITGGITGSTDFNTIVNKPTLISSSAQVSSVTATVTGTNSTELVRGNMADNDQFRILVGGTATNAGFVEIATADDGTEPIHVRQYTGVFTSLARTATLLDGSGNTSFPGSVTANSFVGSISASNGVVSGSAQVVGILSSLNTYTSSNDTTNTTQNNRLTNLESTSASVNISVSNINSFTSSNANTSLNSLTASIAPRLTNLETTSASVNISITNINSFTASNGNTSLNSLTASIASRLTNLETTSASVNISVSNINTFTSSNANTSLNTYTGSNDTTNTTQNSRLTNLETTSASVNGHIADINSKTGSYARTNSTNTFNGTQIISGSLFVTQDLVVLGSSSIQNISSSNVTIGSAYITLNTFTPSSRFAGLIIVDSGSAGSSGSLLYDAVQDEFIQVHKGNGTNVTSSHFVQGPQTYDNLGNELYLTNNRLTKGTGFEHIVDSNITDTGTEISLNSLTSVTGSFVATAGITGSIRATNGVVSGSSQITLSSTTGYSTTINQNLLTTSDVTHNSITGIVRATNGVVSGSSQIVGSSITTNAITIAGTSTALGGTITAEQIRTAIGTVVTGSAQITLSSTTGYGTVINQNLLTTSDVTHNTITGTIRATNGVVSGSSQIVGSSITTNAITIAGTSTALGGTITLATITGGSGIVSGSAQITAGSTTNFATDVKTQLNTNTVVSGSAQITLSSITGYGTVINQNLLTTSDVTHNTITGTIRATNGVVSGSSQIVGSSITTNTITIAGTSTALGGTITLATITGGSGIVSGSSQVIGILSSLNTYTGSNDTTNTTQNTRLSRIQESTSSLNTLTASLATTYEGRASATKTIVSGSSQITLSSTTGFGTYINQAVLTTSSPTFNAISCTSLTETSSERYKENIITLNSSLNKVLNLRGVSYNRKENGANEIGLIAEEVQKIIPEIVTYDNNNQPDSVSYGRLSALLIEGMKEQQKQIEQLKAEIELLKNK